MRENAKIYRIFRNPFLYIAFWQMMTFLILILAVWVVEYQEIATLIYKSKNDAPNIIRALSLTLGIICVAVVTIGHTYLQQKRIINSMVSVCSRCHKVQVSNTYWESMEDYLYEISPRDLTHGLCPECLEATLKEVREKQAKHKAT